MRPVVWATFLAVALVALGLGVVPPHDGSARRNPSAAERFRGVQPRPAARAEARTLSHDIQGDLKSREEDARADVVSKARLWVSEQFAAQRPAIDWLPSAVDVSPLLADVRVEPQELAGLGTMYAGSARLTVRPEQQRFLLDRWHSDLAVRRMGWLGSGLLFVVALLATTAGYVRLDEWTKGYLTWHLQVGAAIVLAALLASAIALVFWNL